MAASRVGVDLGGTKMLVALENEKGEILKSEKFPVDANAGPAGILRDLLIKVTEYFQVSSEDIQGLGFCMAGYYDWEKGTMLGSPNLPGWENYPLRRQLEDLLKCPVVVENDANAAVWGEYCFNAGQEQEQSLRQGAKNIMLITIGTGIGCAVVADGRLLRGARGLAGEIGHLPILPRGGVLCGCGNYGCLETLASGTAMAREGLAQAMSGKKTVLQEMAIEAEAKGSRLQTIHVFEAARQGDVCALEVIDTAAYYLGQGLAAAVHLFDPEMVLIGGGVAGQGEILFAPLGQYFSEMLIPPFRGRVALLPAKLGEEAGVRGILGLLREYINSRG